MSVGDEMEDRKEIVRRCQADEDRVVEECVASLERYRILDELTRRHQGEYDPLNRCQDCGSLAHFEC